MNPFEGTGTIYQMATKYFLISDDDFFVYCSRSVCPTDFDKGEQVRYRAETWDPQRLPDYLAALNIQAKATMVARLHAFERIPSEEAVVSRVQGNHSFLLRYGKDQVYCKPEFYYADIAVGDIVVFRAEMWKNPPSHLAEQYVRYKATTLRFLKKPGTVLATGTFNLIDAKGHYGYVTGILIDGSQCNVFVTAGVMKPPCKDINTMFSVAEKSIVRLMAVEQAANRKNSHTRWRATVATDEVHEVNEEGQVKMDPAYGGPLSDEEEEAEAVEEEETEISASESFDEEEDENDEESETSEEETEEDTDTTSSPLPFNSTRRRRKSAKAVNYNGVAYIPYDPNASALYEANRKLRMIAHYMTGYDCQFCLIHDHPPF